MEAEIFYDSIRSKGLNLEALPDLQKVKMIQKFQNMFQSCIAPSTKNLYYFIVDVAAFNEVFPLVWDIMLKHNRPPRIIRTLTITIENQKYTVLKCAIKLKQQSILVLSESVVRLLAELYSKRSEKNNNMKNFGQSFVIKLSLSSFPNDKINDLRTIDNPYGITYGPSVQQLVEIYLLPEIEKYIASDMVQGTKETKPWPCSPLQADLPNDPKRQTVTESMYPVQVEPYETNDKATEGPLNICCGLDSRYCACYDIKKGCYIPPVLNFELVFIKFTKYENNQFKIVFGKYTYDPVYKKVYETGHLPKNLPKSTSGEPLRYRKMTLIDCVNDMGFDEVLAKSYMMALPKEKFRCWRATKKFNFDAIDDKGNPESIFLVCRDQSIKINKLDETIVVLGYNEFETILNHFYICGVESIKDLPDGFQLEDSDCYTDLLEIENSCRSPSPELESSSFIENQNIGQEVNVIETTIARTRSIGIQTDDQLNDEITNEKLKYAFPFKIECIIEVHRKMAEPVEDTTEFLYGVNHDFKKLLNFEIEDRQNNDKINKFRSPKCQTMFLEDYSICVSLQICSEDTPPSTMSAPTICDSLQNQFTGVTGFAPFYFKKLERSLTTTIDDFPSTQVDKKKVGVLYNEAVTRLDLNTSYNGLPTLWISTKTLELTAAFWQKGTNELHLVLDKNINTKYTISCMFFENALNSKKISKLKFGTLKALEMEIAQTKKAIVKINAQNKPLLVLVSDIYVWDKKLRSHLDGLRKRSIRNRDIINYNEDSYNENDNYNQIVENREINDLEDCPIVEFTEFDQTETIDADRNEKVNNRVNNYCTRALRQSAAKPVNFYNENAKFNNLEKKSETKISKKKQWQNEATAPSNASLDIMDIIGSISYDNEVNQLRIDESSPNNQSETEVVAEHCPVTRICEEDPSNCEEFNTPETVVLAEDCDSPVTWICGEVTLAFDESNSCETIVAAKDCDIPVFKNCEKEPSDCEESNTAETVVFAEDAVISVTRIREKDTLASDVPNSFETMVSAEDCDIPVFRNCENDPSDCEESNTAETVVFAKDTVSSVARICEKNTLAFEKIVAAKDCDIPVSRNFEKDPPNCEESNTAEKVVSANDTVSSVTRSCKKNTLAFDEFNSFEKIVAAEDCDIPVFRNCEKDPSDCEESNTAETVVFAKDTVSSVTRICEKNTLDLKTIVDAENCDIPVFRNCEKDPSNCEESNTAETVVFAEDCDSPATWTCEEDTFTFDVSNSVETKVATEDCDIPVFSNCDKDSSVFEESNTAKMEVFAEDCNSSVIWIPDEDTLSFEKIGTVATKVVPVDCNLPTFRIRQPNTVEDVIEISSDSLIGVDLENNESSTADSEVWAEDRHSPIIRIWEEDTLIFEESHFGKTKIVAEDYDIPVFRNCKKNQLDCEKSNAAETVVLAEDTDCPVTRIGMENRLSFEGTSTVETKFVPVDCDLPAFKIHEPSAVEDIIEISSDSLIGVNLEKDADESSKWKQFKKGLPIQKKYAITRQKAREIGRKYGKMFLKTNRKLSSNRDIYVFRIVNNKVCKVQRKVTSPSQRRIDSSLSQSSVVTTKSKASPNRKEPFNDDSNDAISTAKRTQVIYDDLPTIHSEDNENNGEKSVCKDQEGNIINNNQISSKHVCEDQEGSMEAERECDDQDNFEFKNVSQTDAECERIETTQLYTQELLDGVVSIRFNENIFKVKTNTIQCASNEQLLRTVDQGGWERLVEETVNCNPEVAHSDAMVQTANDENAEISSVDVNQILESDNNDNFTAEETVVRGLSPKTIILSYPKGDATTMDNMSRIEVATSNFDPITELENFQQRTVFENVLKNLLEEKMKSATNSAPNDEFILNCTGNEMNTNEKTDNENQPENSENATIDLQSNQCDFDEDNNITMSMNQADENNFIQSIPVEENNERIRMNKDEISKKDSGFIDTLRLKRISDSKWTHCPPKKRFIRSSAKSIPVLENLNYFTSEPLLKNTAPLNPTLQPPEGVMENREPEHASSLSNSKHFEDISNDEVIDFSYARIDSLPKDDVIMPSIIPGRNLLSAPLQIQTGENLPMHNLIDLRMQPPITSDEQILPQEQQPQHPQFIEARRDTSHLETQHQQQSTLQSFSENPSTNNQSNYQNILQIRNPIDFVPYQFVPPELVNYSVSPKRYSSNVQSQIPVNQSHSFAPTVQNIHNNSRPRIIPNDPNLGYNSSNRPSVSQWCVTSFPPPPLQSQRPANPASYPQPPNLEKPRKRTKKAPSTKNLSFFNPTVTTTSLIQNEQSDRNFVQAQMLPPNQVLYPPPRYADAPLQKPSNNIPPFYPPYYGGGRYFVNPQVHLETLQQEHRYRRMQESFTRMIPFERMEQTYRSTRQTFEMEQINRMLFERQEELHPLPPNRDYALLAQYKNDILRSYFSRNNER